MDSLLLTIVSFSVALGVLITVHEFGHFWVARRLGVKVLRFSIGFGSPLLRRVSRVDGTEYVLAAIPLGGYVKMLDEREAPVEDPAERARAFNRQSLPVRSAIVMAGPLFNFLFAILAFWWVFVSGDSGLRPLIGEVNEGSVAQQAGFQPGEEILAVGGERTPTWESAVYALLSESLDHRQLSIRVRDASGGESIHRLDTQGIQDMAQEGQLLHNLGLVPKRPRLEPVIGELLPGEPAEQAGLKPGDRLISVDGKPLEDWHAWVEYVRQRPGRPLQLKIERDGQERSLVLVPKAVDSQGKRIGRIGASVQVPPDLMAGYRAEIRYGPVEAVGQSLKKTWDLSALMLKMLGKMVVGKVSVKNLSGPISIADSAGKSASYGLIYFIKFLVVVSVSLGVLNLLPIPVLDGGHLFFFLIEAIKGSPLSEKAMETGQKLGMLILLAIMGLAFYVDLNRFLG